MTDMLETHRSQALAWEADELGHMNMRFYLARAAQGRAYLFGQLQMPRAFKAGAHSTVIPIWQHIQYKAELRPAQGLYVQSGILGIGETDMRLLHLIRHSDGTLAASLVESISHISMRTKLPFSWPSRMLAAAQYHMCALPKEAAPRNIDLDAPKPWPPLDGAAPEVLQSLQNIGRGVFSAQECDVFGYVRPVDIMGRISDSAQHLTAAWPDMVFYGREGQSEHSGALLEVFIAHLGRPQPGDSYMICSGLRSANTNTRQLVHWILDPVSGKPWAAAIGVACRFNLKTRRLEKADAKTLKLLEASVVKGLQ